MGVDGCSLRMECPVGPSMDLEGEDDDLPSPRTLRAAAERLAQYTSEQPDAGPPAQAQGFADIYSEVRSAACSIASLAQLMHVALCHATVLIFVCLDCLPTDRMCCSCHGSLQSL